AFKKRRRKNSRRKRGHRQEFTLVRVTEILTDGAKPTKTARPKREPKPVAAAPAAAEEAEPAETRTPKRKAQAKTQAKAAKKPSKPPAKKAAKPKSGGKGKKKRCFRHKDGLHNDGPKDLKPWPTRKQADHPATAATRTVSGSA